MKRTILGIDVKILPRKLRTGTEPWQQAKIIEGNGRETGLSALNFGEDSFVRFVDALGVEKTWIIYHTYSSDRNDLGSLQNFVEEIDRTRGEQYPFVDVTEWIDDLPLYYAEKREKQLRGEEPRADRNLKNLVAAAFLRQRDAIVVSDWNFSPQGIRYWLNPTEPSLPFLAERTDANKKPAGNFILWDAVDLVTGIDNGLLETTVDESKYPNSKFEEELLGNKGVFCYIDELFPDLGINLRKYFPATTVWGSGLQSKQALEQWFDQQKKECVRKPLTGAQGRGVRFFKTGDYRTGIQSHVRDERHAEAAYVNIVIDMLGGRDPPSKRAVLIQEFVPSVRIGYKGKGYDGCARSVIVNDQYIKACWRLALDPLDSHAPAERRFRANTALGSDVTDMTAQQEDLVAKLSEMFSRDFFAAATALRQRIEHENFALFANERYYRPDETVRMLFYLQRLKRSAEGCIDLRATFQKYLPGEFAERVIEVYERL